MFSVQNHPNQGTNRSHIAPYLVILQVQAGEPLPFHDKRPIFFPNVTIKGNATTPSLLLSCYLLDFGAQLEWMII